MSSNSDTPDDNTGGKLDRPSLKYENYFNDVAPGQLQRPLETRSAEWIHLNFPETLSTFRRIVTTYGLIILSCVLLITGLIAWKLYDDIQRRKQFETLIEKGIDALKITTPNANALQPSYVPPPRRARTTPTPKVRAVQATVDGQPVR